MLLGDRIAKWRLSRVSYSMATGNTTHESRMSDENELWVTYLNTLGSNDSH
jgi:hypothetical protein